MKAKFKLIFLDCGRVCKSFFSHENKLCYKFTKVFFREICSIPKKFLSKISFYFVVVLDTPKVSALKVN